MKLLRRWLSLRYRLRARRWKARAIAAEEEVGRLKLQLSAETWRNRMREDTFASATVLGSRNMWGLAPRSGPAQIDQPRPAPVQPVDPYNFTGPDKLEFEVEYWPYAEANGLSRQQATQRFFQEVILPRRQPLNDDFGAN